MGASDFHKNAKAAKATAGSRGTSDPAVGGRGAGGSRVSDGSRGRDPEQPRIDAAYLRAENEDDDGYDPYSDRRPEPEPLFERDPWG